MADEKNEAQLSDSQLDEANGGRNWIESEYSYASTNYFHLTDYGRIQIETEVYGVLAGGGATRRYKCKECGQTWAYDESSVRKYFAMVL